MTTKPAKLRTPHAAFLTPEFLARLAADFPRSSTSGLADPDPGPPSGTADLLRRIPQEQLESARRCHYRDSAGRRCRLPREESHPTFCTRHAHPAAPDPGFGAPGKGAVPVGDVPAADLSAELLGPLDDFRTNTSINYTLGRLLILKAAGAISARDAAVIAYICQLLIQTVPGVRKEIIWSDGHSENDKEVRRVLQATSSLWDSDDEPDSPGARK